jgi:hypothetical protein
MPSETQCFTCHHLNDEQLERVREHVEPARTRHRRLRALGGVGVVGSTLAFAIAARVGWEFIDSEAALNAVWLGLTLLWFLALTRSLHTMWVHHEQGTLRHQIRRMLPTTTITANDPAYSFEAFNEENARTKN